MIVIGIPTYNESDTIATAVNLIEVAIIAYATKRQFSLDQFIIVNADNNSADGTGRIFKDLKTTVVKEGLTTNGPGKGRNLLAIFTYAHNIQASVVATIDADISTIATDWVEKLVDPIMRQTTDMTVPLYQRNRFEGSTTNHFAFPLVAAYFGRQIRQPIGGEFAFSARLVDYLLQQHITASTYQYGIDIFCTLHAVGGGFTVLPVTLGKKWHKPSFPKIAPMFIEVAASALAVLQQYPRHDVSTIVAGHETNITAESKKPDSQAVQTLLAEVYQYYRAHIERYSDWLSTTNEAWLKQASDEGLLVSEQQWVTILARAITATCQHEIKPERLAELLMPIFIWRTTTFWQEIENVTTDEVEAAVQHQMRALRAELL